MCAKTMYDKIKYLTATLLLISFVLLSIMIPGGAIETRSFTHIDPYILGSFNIFLTFLGMTSLLLTYFVIRKLKWAYFISIICAASYLSVYALDLAGIFPISPDQMPTGLFVIEIVGSIISIPLVYFSILGLSNNSNDNKPEVVNIHSKKFAFIALILIAVCVNIIIFATKSAMGN
ncbi:hypothetical protein [Psychromonas sp. SR45-3]|uniref:hypothetical protein n=1 Tax=Psychromonas sp. SR45-3 TaxID=2760930 RepID=UPI001C72590A|nr:hypothetical protein [Psychromonas sp. SR45-3]